MRSVDVRNNNISETWLKEFLRLFDTNRSLINLDLRENDGFSSKMHRDLALKLLKNIHFLKDNGELEGEEEEETGKCFKGGNAMKR